MTAVSVSEPFTVEPEQDEFRSVVRSFLRDRSAEAAVRAAMASELGYDRDVWHQLAAQLDLAGLLIPTEYGGSGLSDVELGIAMEEMGRVLLCAPYLSSAVLATCALLAAGDETAARDYLPEFAAGSRVGTLAFIEERAPWSGGSIELTATPAGAGYRLTGTKRFVLDGASADVVLVVARSPEGVGLFAVESTSPGLIRRALPTMDLTRRQADLEFRDVPARLVGAPGDGQRTLDAALSRAQVALAAEQIGGAQEALDDAVAYAKTRIQFGVPIGSFQAIKHRCADTLVEVESARSVAIHAAWVAAHDPADLEISAHLASAYCSAAYTKAAMSNVQVHGGIGFTWEHSAHLYLKRAKTSEILFGPPRYHRRLLGDRIGL